MTLPWATIAAGLLLGYACGSVPFGLLLTRGAGLGDIRAVGSGNIGATNVLRTGHKGLAAVTLLLDMLKGTVAVLVAARLLGPEAGLAAALGAMLGHCFPVWLGFRGGKGVATFIGCLLVLDWRALLVLAAIWIGTAAIVRISSLAGLLSSPGATLFVWVLGDDPTAAVLSVMTAVLWAKHRANIVRLSSGTEPRIGARR